MSSRVTRLAVALALASCDRSRPPPRSATELHVGVLAELSGPRSATSGIPTMRAAQLAAEQANRAGGLEVAGRRYRVVLHVIDNRDTEQGATSGARRLINEFQVSAIVGPQASRLAIPVAHIAENARVPLITPMSTHPRVTAGKRYVFRTSFVDDVQGRSMARFAVDDLEASRGAVLFDESNPYNRHLAETFRAAFQRLGGEVVAYESYTSDDATDFRLQLQRIRDAGPQVLVLPNYTADARIQLRQAREVGFTGAILGSDAWEFAALAAEVPAAEGAYLTHHWHPDALGSGVAEFRQQFRTAYNTAPQATAAATFDAMGLIFRAVRARASTDPESIRAGLAETRDFAGVTGPISFCGTGDPLKGVVVLRMEGGRVHFHARMQPEAVSGAATCQPAEARP
jgi:branched-chain amino acid transport system substrate-binding protein